MLTCSSDSLTGNILFASSELVGRDRDKQDADSLLPLGGIGVVRGQAFKETQAGKGLGVVPTWWGQRPGAQQSLEQVPPDTSPRLVPEEGVPYPTNRTNNDSCSLVSHLLAASFFFLLHFFPMYFYFIYLVFIAAHELLVVACGI